MKYITIPLQGTAKQQDWASAIRSKKLAAINATWPHYSTLPDIQYRMAWLHTIPRAHWWISHKDTPVYTLVTGLELKPIWPKRYAFTTSHDVLDWASALFGTIVLDTETTGLDTTSEIVEIAAIDLQGHVMLNTLVKPSSPIPPDATAIHGITDSMVTTAPTFSEVWPLLRALLCQHRVVIYNASYDMKLIRNLAAKELLPCPHIHTDCAMLAYAAYKGDPGKWWKLEVAARDLDIQVSAQAHRALADCVTTLGIIDHLKHPEHTLNILEYV